MDDELEIIIEENRQSMDKLRNLTEDLAVVVEHEKRVVEDASPRKS